MIRFLIIYLMITSLSIAKLFTQDLEAHMFYAPNAQYYTGLVFLSDNYKILTNMDDILLLNRENMVLDTLSINSTFLGNDQIFSIVVMDELHFNAVCGNGSYLINIKDEAFNFVKKVAYSERKKYGKFSHIYLTMDQEIAIQYSYKRNGNVIIFDIYDNSNNQKATTELTYNGTFNQYTNISYHFPTGYFYHKNTLIFSNQFNNTLYFINLRDGDLKKLDLLPIDLNKGSQNVFFDRATEDYYMMRDIGVGDSSSHSYELYNLKIGKNQYNKLKSFSYRPSSFRGGIFNGSFIMTGLFNNESAWFTMPISEIDKYRNYLKLQINE